MSRPMAKPLLRHAAWVLPCLLYLWGVLGAPHLAGRELLDFPDAEEYALLATRLAHGLPPVLEIGMQTYPSRYPLTVPLLMTPVAWLTGSDLTRMWWGSLLFGLLATALMARTGTWLLGSRWAGGLAAAFWALHPETVKLGTMAMSETGLTLMFLLMLAAARPWLDPSRRAGGVGRALLLGLLLGWLTLTKAPFAYWALALSALAIARGASERRWGPPIALAAAGLACLAADLVYRHWAFGDWRMNGYRYWFPAVYGELGRIFNPQYLWRPWLPGETEGNLAYYGRRVLGRTDDFYAVYMALAAAGATLCILWPGRRGRPHGRIVGLMAGWAAVGVLFCGLYFFQSQRFAHLWMPVVDWLVAWGLVCGPRWTALRRGWAGRLRLHRVARVMALLAILVLLRGELLRVRGYYHLANHTDRQRTAFVDQIRPMLDRVGPGQWLLTNYQLPLVDAWRPQAGPTVALNANPVDGFLMNSHVSAIWSFGLEPHGRRAAWNQWLTAVPEAWRAGPTLWIGPDEAFVLEPAARRALLSQPFYLLVVQPPFFPSVERDFETVLRPMLAAEWSLEPIQSSRDVTLYEGRWKATGDAPQNPPGS